MKLKRGMIEIEYKKEVKVVRNLTACPGKLWITHPWRCSKTGWTGFEQSDRNKDTLPCDSWCGLDDLLKVPSIPKHSMIESSEFAGNLYS